MKKKILFAVSLGLVLVLLAGSVAWAQTPTPPAKGGAFGKGWGGMPFPFFKPFGDWQVFDAVAQALKLTPTQLFEQLHSGKTLEEIAKAQGVDMQAVQDAIKAVQTAQAKTAIQKAQESGKITKEQAEWMLKGLENGWWGRMKPMMPRWRGK
ncbi:MAG: hypothetical protein N2439_09050 [Anaerolineae bacterium]|nr:hypothetical protein [Anaerolineae bacterium]